MSDQQQGQWKPGDEANGYRLDESGQWLPIQPEPAPRRRQWPPIQPEPAPRRRRMSRRTRWIVGGTTVATLIAVMAIGATGSGDGDGTTTTDDASAAAQVEADRQAAEAAAQAQADAEAKAKAAAEAKAKAAAALAASTYTVVDVVDGDTLDVVKEGVTEQVRIAGIDSPERGECGFAESKANLESMVAGQSVVLVSGSPDDRDQYDRLIRYVDVGGVDAGLKQIEAGYAIARYDSRDGYGAHQRETQYIAADTASTDFRCPAPPPPPASPAAPTAPDQPAAPPPAGNGCHPSYVEACLPIVDDLDCADVPNPVTVVGPDVYRLDRDNDGIGCERN